MITRRPAKRHKLTFAVLALGVAAYALLQSLVVPALSTLEYELRTTQGHASWVLTVYLLSAAICTPIMGRLGDLYEKKRIFVIALAALTLGSLLAALAASLPMMLFARVVQGMGGGVLPLAFAIIREDFPAHKVAGAIGVLSAITSAGAALGVVLAGPIMTALGFRWLFWIPFGMVIAAGVAALTLIPESTVRTAGKVNWVAALLMTTWLTTLLLGASSAPTAGWGSPLVICLLAVAAVVLVIWVSVESRSAYPLVDMSVMRIRSVWAANLVALLMGVGMYGVFGFLPQFVQTPSSAGFGFGASVSESGLMLLPFSFGMFVLGLAFGRLELCLHSRSLMIIGLAVSSLGCFSIAFLHHTKVEVYFGTSLAGMGFGLAFSAMSHIVLGSVPAEQTSVANGMNTNIRMVGGALGAAVVSGFLTAGPSTAGAPQEADYVFGFQMLGGAVGLGVAAAFIMPVIARAPSPSPKS